MAIRVEADMNRGGTRAMDARAANNRIAEKAAQLRVVSRVPMLCECGAPDCRTLVLISLPDYRELRDAPDRFLTEPGHPIEGAELEQDRGEYTIRRAG
jgi:hypothetical protein